MKDLKIDIIRDHMKIFLPKIRTSQKGFIKFTKKNLILALISLTILTSLIFFLSPKGVEAAWSASHGSWAKRKQLTLVNNSGSTLNANVPYQVTIDTKSLYQSRGDLQNDCDDLRIVYQPDNSTSTELARDYTIAQGATDCSDSGGTIVTFPLQANITNGSSSTSYYMYYANPSIGAPNASRLSAYNIGAKTATFVAPFNGSTTALAAGSGTPTTATGAIRYSGGKSGLSFNGLASGNKVSAANASSIQDLPSGDFTAETWFYSTETSGVDDGVFSKINVGGTEGWGVFVDTSNSRLRLKFDVNFATTDLSYITSNNVYTHNSWNHLAVVFISATKTAKIFVNGIETSYTTSTAGSGSYVSDSADNLDIADDRNNPFQGYLDETRVSNVARYSSNFTPPTSPFVRDANTKLLYHFDENGDDPRNTGKAIDDSGNGNHGTITGAKYVAGLVGVDASTTNTGNTPVQSYAGHQGVFIEEGTTNKITNPSFENSSQYDTGWTAAGSNLTASVNTTSPFYKFGSQSEKIIASASSISGTSNMRTISINAGSTSTHTLSAYVYDGTTGNVGGTVSSSIAKLVYNGTAQTTTYTDMGGGWWRLSYSAAGINAAAEYGVEAQVSKTIYVDGVQLEALAYPTSYTDGSLGSSYSWSGTANASTSSRTVANLSYNGSSSNVSSTKGALSIWVKPTAASAAVSDPYIVNFAAGGAGALRITTSTGKITQSLLGGCTNRAATSAYTPGNWYHVVLTWSTTSGNCNFYINSAAQTSSTGYTNSNSGLWGGDMNVGSYQAGGFSTNTNLADMRIYNDELSATDVGDLYNEGLASHSEGGVVEKAKPVLNWKFDEGTGTTANDSSKSADNGTLSNMATTPTGNSGWQTEDKCIAGKCLAFDGSNDYVSKSYFLDTELDPDAKDMALSAWFRHSSTISGTDTLLARYSSGGYKVYMNSSGFICFGIDDDSSFDPDDSACSTVSYADSKWHQITAVKIATTSITIYVDGTQVGTDASIAATGSISGSSPTFYVGIDSDGSSNPWDGSIDDVEVYGDQLSSAQVLSKYNAKAATAQAGSVLGAQSPNGGTLSNGLVGYWKMDESSWTNDCSTTSVTDSSGNGNNGKACPNSTGPTGGATGKFGNGGTLTRSSSQYIQVDQATLFDFTDVTYSVWVKPATLVSDEVIFENKSGATAQLYLTNDTKVHIWGRCGNNPSSGFGTIATGSWYHLTWTIKGSAYAVYVNGALVGSGTGCSASQDTTGLNIGFDGASNYVDGTLDEARVYNRALSPAEVSQLYNFAPGPVGYWKMDEGSGNPTDSSGNGNNLTNSGSVIYNPGKFGMTLNTGQGSIDSNKWSSITNGSQTGLGVTGPITVMAWVKPLDLTCNGSYGVNPTVFSKAHATSTFASSTQLGYSLGASCSGGSQINGPRLSVTSDGTAGSVTHATDSNPAVLSPNTWYHFTGVYDGSTLKTYLNGVLFASTSYSSGIFNNTGEFTVGGIKSDSPSPIVGDWAGMEDEVKVYNYARTQKQIIEDMNGSHPAPGSPVGSPALYLKFDEGAANTCSGGANDACNSGSAGSAIDALFNGGITPTTAGKFGKGLTVDGTNDYLTIPDNDAVELTDDFTISMWMNLTSAPASSLGGVIFAKDDGAAVYQPLGVELDNTMQLRVWASSNCSSWNVLNSDSTPQLGDLSTPLTFNTWHYFALRREGSTWQVFIDGIKRGTTATAAGTLCTNSRAVNMFGGFQNPSSANGLKGTVDEYKIYKSALTDSQIQLDMNRGQAQVMGALSDKSGNQVQSQNNEYCIPGDTTTCTGPVARYDFEETSGTTNNDTSGNANLCDNSSSYAGSIGKIGRAYNVVTAGTSCGTGATVTGFSTGATGLTAEAWIYPKSEGQFGIGEIISKTPAWLFRFGPSATNALDFSAGYGSTDLERTSSDNAITLNKWQHVAVSWTGSKTASTAHLYVNGQEVSYQVSTTGVGSPDSDTGAMQIGNLFGGGGLFDGKIDQVRLFNYGRTAAQIAWDYNKGGPLAYWKMDECSGTAIYDSSVNGAGTGSNGLDGTLTIGASGSQTSAGSCSVVSSATAWYNGVTGKRNYSLNFDGTDDKVSVTDSNTLDLTSDFTLAAWVSRAGGAGAQIISKTNDSSDGGYAMLIGSSGEVYCRTNNGTSSTNSSTAFGAIPADSSWHHAAIVRSGTSCKVYIDGIDRTNSTGTHTTLTANANNLLIGTRPNAGGEFWNGKIDDARIYNYALTAKQVQMMMNDGANRFGPATGAP